MRSIPLAMTWELFRHRSTSLFGTALAAILLPMIVLAQLWQEGAIMPQDQSMIVLHVALMQISAFCFGMAVLSAQGNPARLFALPLATSTIVVGHLLPAMTLVAVHSLVSGALMNSLFQLDWPLWGPAFFLAVALAAIQSVLWLTERSIWLPVAVASVAGVLGVWFKSRYGPPFLLPNHYWMRVSLADATAMFAFAVFAVATGMAAVSRNRRGDVFAWPRLVAGFELFSDTAQLAGKPFRNAEQAQLWFESRSRGWVMPAAAALGIAAGTCIWLLFSREQSTLFEGFAVGGWFLSAIGMVGGLVLGNRGPKDDVCEIGAYLATRPMTTPVASRMILIATARSVLFAWLVWVVSLLVLCVILWLNGALSRISLPAVLGWWYFPVTLGCSWTVAAVVASIVMTGRQWFLVNLSATLCITFFCLILLAKYAMSYDTRLQFAQGVTIACGIAVASVSIVLFAAARRRLLIGWPTVYVAASLWAVLGASFVFIWQQSPVGSTATSVLLVGMSALSVAPFAAAPLALAWNRNR